MEPLLTGFLIAACYDFIKSGSIRGIKKVGSKVPKGFEDIFEETIIDISKIDISKKYDIVETDFKSFFRDDDVEKLLEQYVESDKTPDFEILAEILDDYIIKDETISSKQILEDFLKKLEDNLTSYPVLKEQLFLKYLRALKQVNAELSIKVSSIKEDTESIREMFKLPQVFGKIFRPNDFPNNVDFLKENSELLNDDPYYIHEITLVDGNVKYALMPKNEDAEKLDPIHGTFTIIFEKKDGKVISLEDMLEDARKKGKPLIIEADSIKGFRLFKGDKTLRPNETKPGRLVIMPHPVFPTRSVSISIPGKHISYNNIVLQVDERSESLLIVSNQSQESNVKFRFKFLLGKENTSKFGCQFDIEPLNEKMDAKEIYDYLKFISELRYRGTLVVTDLQTNKNICIFNEIVVPYSDVFDSEEYLKLIEKLVFIQDMTEKRIPFPFAIDPSNLISVDSLYDYLKYEKAEISVGGYDFGFNLYKEYAREIIEIIGKEGYIEKLRLIKNGFSSNICGVEINLIGDRLRRKSWCAEGLWQQI